MKRFFCLVFVFAAASAAVPEAKTDLASPTFALNVSRERDVTIDVCNYHTDEYCNDGWQCCDSSDLLRGYCCSTSAYCCVSTSMYTSNSLCCTWDRCCPSSTGYYVQCCGYDEECCDHECKDSCTPAGLSIGLIVAIVVGAGILLCIVVAIVVAVKSSNAAARRRRAAAAAASSSSSKPATISTTPVYGVGAGPAVIQASPYPGAAMAPATIQSGPYPGAQVPGPYPGASMPPPAYASGPYPGASGPYPGAQMPQQQQPGVDPRLESALQTVRQGIVVALVGIANDRMSVDDAVTLMALAASQALGKCQCSSQSEFDRAASLVFQYMNSLFAEIIPSMSKEQREALVTTVLQRMTALAQQQKRARLEESLDAIRQTFVTVWMGVTNNKISLDDAQQLMGVAVAAALRNCSISSREQLSAHISAFTQWMMIVADEVAPMLPAEVKRQLIQNIWANATAQF